MTNNKKRCRNGMTLDERNAKIVERVKEGATLASIAKEFEVSPERARQIKYKAAMDRVRAGELIGNVAREFRIPLDYFRNVKQP